MSLFARSIACAFLLASAVSPASALGRGDTTLPADIAYSGYRLHVREVELVKEKRGRYLVRFDVVNTGRRPVAMGPGLPVRYLQTVFDESLAAGGLVKLGLPLRAAIVDSRERFEVGEWKEGLEYWLDPAVVDESPELTKDRFERRRVQARTQRADGSPPARATPREEGSCPDLALTGLRIVIRDGNSATVQFTIANAGGGVLGDRELPEAIPLDVFLGGAAEISGSSRLVAQLNLADELRKRPGGQLAGGEAMTLIEQIDIRSATRYTGVLTARLDGGQAVRECDETNNEASVLLQE